MILVLLEFLDLARLSEVDVVGAAALGNDVHFVHCDLGLAMRTDSAPISNSWILSLASSHFASSLVDSAGLHWCGMV